MKYLIARPINGICLNGNEYVLNDDGSEMVFETKNSCLEFVKNNVTTDNPEDYLWEIPGEIECT